MGGFASSCLALCYKYFSEPSRPDSVAARTRSALYSFFHARSPAAARANDKLCTRICIFDTWLQRLGRNVPALSYVTDPAARSPLSAVFRFVVSLSSLRSFPRLFFSAPLSTTVVPRLVRDINFAFYYIVLYYVKFVYYSEILFLLKEK